jgi:hypothetical protein
MSAAAETLVQFQGHDQFTQRSLQVSLRKRPMDSAVKTEKRPGDSKGRSQEDRTMRIILAVLLVLLLIGALPAWPYSAGWGYYPSGLLGLLLVVLLVAALVRRV